MIKVVKFKVRFNGIKHIPGDIIYGLSEQEEDRLVAEGFAAKYPDESENKLETESDFDISNDSEDNTEPQEETTEADQSETQEDTMSAESLTIEFNPDEYVKQPTKKKGK